MEEKPLYAIYKKLQKENEELKQLCKTALEACNHCPVLDKECGINCSIKDIRKYFLKNMINASLTINLANNYLTKHEITIICDALFYKLDDARQRSTSKPIFEDEILRLHKKLENVRGFDCGK